MSDSSFSMLLSKSFWLFVLLLDDVCLVTKSAKTELELFFFLLYYILFNIRLTLQKNIRDKIDSIKFNSTARVYPKTKWDNILYG